MTRPLLALASAAALASCQSKGLSFNDAGFFCGLAGARCGSAADCCGELECSVGACAFPLSGSGGSSSGSSGAGSCSDSSCQADGQCCTGYCVLGQCTACLSVGSPCNATQPSLAGGPCCPGTDCVASLCISGWRGGCGVSSDGGSGGTTGTAGSSSGSGTSSTAASSGSWSSSGGTASGDAGAGACDLCAEDGGLICASSGACLCDAHGNCVFCLTDADCTFGHCDSRAGSATYGSCVPCVANSQCDGGICDRENACVPDCRSPGFPGCTGLADICNPQTGLCVGCLTSANCSEGLQCNTAILECVQCLTAADCPYDRPGCRDGTCGGCVTAADCPPNDGCSGICYCIDDTGCGGDVPVCVVPGGDQANGASGCGCSDSTQCCGSLPACAPGSFAGLANDLHGACVPPCTTGPNGCQSGVCNPVSGLCQECLVDADCSDTGYPHCSDAGSCVTCTDDGDCVALDAGTPFCASGQCVGCLSYAQCPPSSPGCSSSSKSCGSCVINADCPPGLGCFTDLVCAPFCGLGGASSGCVACVSDVDCGGASCDAATGFCG